jgi:hypothetical protein
VARAAGKKKHEKKTSHANNIPLTYSGWFTSHSVSMFVAALPKSYLTNT